MNADSWRLWARPGGLETLSDNVCPLILSPPQDDTTSRLVKLPLTVSTPLLWKAPFSELYKKSTKNVALALPNFFNTVSKIIFWLANGLYSILLCLLNIASSRQEWGASRYQRRRMQVLPMNLPPSDPQFSASLRMRNSLSLSFSSI